MEQRITSTSPPRVFVPQNPKRRDETGEFVEAFDITPAAEYGDLVHLVSPTAKPFDPVVIAEINDGLRDYRPDRDYILTTGTIVLVAVAVAAAAMHSGGRVRVLSWSKRDRRYSPIDVNIGTPAEVA